MDHAKEHNRESKTFQKRATRKASQAVTNLGQVYDTHKGCAGNSAGSDEERTNNNVAHAFLKCRFLPKIKEPARILDCAENKKMERDFYKSLSYLQNNYNIALDDFNYLGFPYNIQVTLHNLKMQYGNIANFEELKIEQINNKFCLVNEECLSQNNVLYYIPVIPLYRWMRTKERKKGAILLLSVFSYLYHAAKIPFYRDDNSFLYGEYEMLQEWLMDDEDEDHETRQADFKRAEIVGDIIGQKIYNLKNLDFFGQRTEHFKCSNQWDKKVLSIAKEAFMIFEKYPNETIMKNTKLTNYFGEDEEDNFHDTMYIEHYVSFCADHEDWLGMTLVQCVNDQFQEYSKIEEPTIRNIFDTADKRSLNLDFEVRLFKVLDRLATLLINT